MKAIQKHPFITGTLLLTATGLISRIIGFFYRIYLTSLFGEEGMGIYQLLNPVLAITFSVCAAGYQSAISKLCAEYAVKKDHSSYAPLLAGILVCLPLSLACCAILQLGAVPIGARLLQDTRTIPMIRILSWSVPFSTLHSCINGYFYGMKKAGIPALTQLAEQLVRVGSVYLLSLRILAMGKTPSPSVAILGLALGELCSMTINLLAILLQRRSQRAFALPKASTYLGLFQMAIPLTANRLILNALLSAEAVSIPACLKSYGYDTKTALSVYGVLTGMALPLILFPNALTGSVAVLLLPSVSEQSALGDTKGVRNAVAKTVTYCFGMGVFCFLFFFCFGKDIGGLLFHSALAGRFIATLSFICPFLYLDPTLSGILHGLGMASQLFFINIFSLTLRLCFVFFGVPHFGIAAYFIGMLTGQLVQCALYLLCLRKKLR